MRIVPQAPSYATLANAEKALVKALSLTRWDAESVRWAVLAQADGRYTPAVFPDDHQIHDMIALSHVARVAVVR